MVLVLTLNLTRPGLVPPDVNCPLRYFGLLRYLNFEELLLQRRLHFHHTPIHDSFIPLPSLSYAFQIPLTTLYVASHTAEPYKFCVTLEARIQDSSPKWHQHLYFSIHGFIVTLSILRSNTADWGRQVWQQQVNHFPKQFFRITVVPFYHMLKVHVAWRRNTYMVYFSLNCSSFTCKITLQSIQERPSPWHFVLSSTSDNSLRGAKRTPLSERLSLDLFSSLTVCNTPDFLFQTTRQPFCAYIKSVSRT